MTFRPHKVPSNCCVAKFARPFWRFHSIRPSRKFLAQPEVLFRFNHPFGLRGWIAGFAHEGVCLTSGYGSGARNEPQLGFQLIASRSRRTRSSRSAGRTFHQLLTGDQSENRQGSRAGLVGDAARDRRRVDRMKMLFAALHESDSGTKRTSKARQAMSGPGD